MNTDNTEPGSKNENQFPVDPRGGSTQNANATTYPKDPRIESSQSEEKVANQTAKYVQYKDDEIVRQHES